MSEGKQNGSAKRASSKPAPREKFRTLLRGLGWAQQGRKRDVRDATVDIGGAAAAGKPIRYLCVAHASLVDSARASARDARYALLTLAFATGRPYRDVEWTRDSLVTGEPAPGRILDLVRELWPKILADVPRDREYGLVAEWVRTPVTQELQAKKLREKCTDLARRAKVIEKPEKATVEKLLVGDGAAFRARAGNVVEYGESAVLALVALVARLESLLKVEMARAASEARAKGLEVQAKKRQRVRVDTEVPRYDDVTEVDLLQGRTAG